MPTELILPPLFGGIVPHTCGSIQRQLRDQITVTVEQTDQFRISPRRTETLYQLSNGESIIVTSRQKLPRPKNVTGILHVTNGKHEWLSHQRIDDYGKVVASNALRTLKDEITSSWNNSLRFSAEQVDSDGVILSGLRPPQLGALHAIGAHWSHLREPATIVMPTGTGKTETMLAALPAYNCATTLVIVPSRVLRDQTARKALGMGLLRSLRILDEGAQLPIVGVVTSRPRTASDLDIFDSCNIVVSTMAALAQGTAAPLIEEIARRVDTLVVDEAHHIAARTWSIFRQAFADARILQFTATPYRSDGDLVDGKVIYNYPLRSAQRSGYFKRIHFKPVYEIEPDTGDRSIATKTLEQLRSDLQEGRNHLLLARCDSITRAESLEHLYRELGSEFNPVVVHSELPGRSKSLERLRSGESRVVICVDMLGEGFDLPRLKIAAVHDTHKSLAVLLQFTGRFTRSAGPDIGDATVVANIADQKVSTALERLYSEDADWNHLLSEYSSDAVREHAELLEFLSNSRRLDEDTDDSKIAISHQLLRPKFSTVIFRSTEFSPLRFHEGLERSMRVHRVWLNDARRTLFFVTVQEPRLDWTRSREVRDRQWDLYALHHDVERGLLFIHSSDKSSLHQGLARVVGGAGATLVTGDKVFRMLGHIKRLVLYNLGVRKHGRRNLRYAMYTGEAVQEALTHAERVGSVKNNLFGAGFEQGAPVSVGCSIKGRIWSREQGSVPAWLEWCEAAGRKLLDDTINTEDIITNLLVPEEAQRLPDSPVLSIEWPVELLHVSEDHVILDWGTARAPIGSFDIKVTGVEPVLNRIIFDITSRDATSTMFLELGGPQAFSIGRLTGSALTLKIGSSTVPLESYLSDYPPLFRFVDMSELDGNLLIKPKGIQSIRIPPERFEPWSWAGIDFKRESMVRDGTRRPNSIQERAADHYVEGGFDIVFDDDGPGEAADLVCLKEEADHIRLALVHCKGAQGDVAGRRIGDVVEVASQAVRSAKWKWRFRELCQHLARRERDAITGRPSRFLAGNGQMVAGYASKSRFKSIQAEIVIVQPGLSKSQCTPDQTTVLASAHTFLKETIDVDLDIICSD